MNKRIFGLFVVFSVICAFNGCTDTTDPAQSPATDSGQATQPATSTTPETNVPVAVARATPEMPAIPAVQTTAQTPIAPGQATAASAPPMAELLYTGKHPRTRITNGGFEWFYDGSEFPLDWTGLLHAPVCEPEETIVKHGKQSVKLTGLADDSATLKSRTAPSVEDLRGETVTFGAWVYSSDPEKTTVGVIYDWSKYRTASPSGKNQWQLVKVVTTIPEDAEFLHFGITLQPSDEPVVCYVDGAALYLE